MGRQRTTYTVVRELEAEDVRHVDDGLVFRVIDLGSGDICLDPVNHFIRTLSSRRVGALKRKKKQGYVNLPSSEPS